MLNITRKTLSRAAVLFHPLTKNPLGNFFQYFNEHRKNKKNKKINSHEK